MATATPTAPKKRRRSPSKSAGASSGGKSKRATSPALHLLEIASGVGRVDTENAIIYEAKVVGLESRNLGRTIGLDPREFNGALDNPYRYSHRALEEAIPMYEGAQIRIKHPPTRTGKDGRRVTLEDNDAGLRVSGELRNVRMKPDGLYGDIHLIKARDGVAVVLEAAEKFPKQIALSHNADGVPVLKGDRAVIDKILKVYSVDIVDDEPGTTNSLFESYQEPHTVKRTIKQIIESFKDSPVRKSLLEMIEEPHPDPDKDDEEGAALSEMDGETLGDMEVEVPAASSLDEQVEATFDALAMAAVKDPALDADATGAAVTDLLKKKDELTGKKPAEEPAAVTTAESRKPIRHSDPQIKKLLEEQQRLTGAVESITKENDELKLDKRARSLMESAKREIDDVRLAAVKAVPDSERLQLIESWPEQEEPNLVTVPRPPRSAPLVESHSTTLKTGDAFVAEIRG